MEYSSCGKHPLKQFRANTYIKEKKKRERRGKSAINKKKKKN